MTFTLMELIGSVNISIEKASLRRKDRIIQSDVSILYGRPPKSFLIQQTPQWRQQRLGREDHQSWYVPANPIDEFNPPTSESAASCHEMSSMSLLIPPLFFRSPTLANDLPLSALPLHVPVPAHQVLSAGCPHASYR
jgi:hypothetical protein